MSIINLIKRKALSAGDISLVIQLAWEDRTAFETMFDDRQIAGHRRANV
jgi:hypothetical protein